MICPPTIKPCENIEDPLGGAVLPTDVVAQQTITDGVTTWSTNPPTPTIPPRGPLRLQSGGPLLIDDFTLLLL